MIFGNGHDGIVRDGKLAPTRDGYFSGYIRGVMPGDRYKYRLDGGDSFPDPASRYQPMGVHGPSEVVDPNVFTWTDHDWSGPKREDLVIYEVHVGTATRDGTFDALITYLGDIRKLGATAIQLMPIADFAGNRNWGYDGVNLFAPSHVYGGPEAFRRLVNAAHDSYGLAVIVDVVFNHVGPEGNYLPKFSSSYFDKNHATPWGQGLNYGSKSGRQVRDFIVANCCYWAFEYHVDGLRLDAIQAIKDTEEPHIVREITTGVRDKLPSDRSFLIIAEDEFNNPALIQPIQKNGFGLDAIYADDFHHQIHVALTNETTGYYQDYSGTVDDLATTLRQSWWFTGQVSQWRTKRDGILTKVGEHADNVPDAEAFPPECFIWCIQNHDQIGNRPLGDRLSNRLEPEAYRAASLLLLLSPYTPLLFMGQEWAASTPFLFFTDYADRFAQGATEGRMNGLNDLFPGYDRGSAPKPPQERTFTDSKLRWHERSQPAHSGILRLYTDLLQLRREQKALRHRTRESFTARSIAQYSLALRREGPSPEDELLSIVNLKGRLTLDLNRKPETRPPTGLSWTALLDTEDSKYGGKGSTHLSSDAILEMSGPGAVLLGLQTSGQLSQQQAGSERSVVSGHRVRNKIFISYARKDVKWLHQIQTVLAPAVSSDSIETWDDGQLQPGKWRPQLEEAMNTVGAVLFLASINFCASDFIRDVELPNFLLACQKEGVKVLWVALTKSLVEQTPLLDFQCLNDPEHPLDRLSPALRRQALVGMARQVVGYMKPGASA